MVTATLVSPVTGNLTVYELTSFLQLANGPIAFDTASARNQLNNEFYAQNVDTVCNEVKYIASNVATWIQVDNWVPETETLGVKTLGIQRLMVEPVSATMAAIIFILKIIIPLIVAGIVIVAVAWVAGNIYMAAAYPAIFTSMPDPTTGKTFKGTREEVLSWNAAHYPNLWFDPTTTLGFDPTDPNFEAKKEWVILNTPPGWGQPFGGDLLGMLMPIIVIIGGVVIAAIVLPPVIRWVTHRGKE